MKLDANYGGVRWSKHALARLEERGLTQGEVWRAFQKPQTSRWARSKRGIKYVRTDDGKRVEVVAKKNERTSEWVIMSCWGKRVENKTRKNWVERMMGRVFSRI